MKRIILIIGICAALAIPITMFRNAIEHRINHETILRTQAETDAIQAKEEAELKESQIQELQKSNEELQKQLQSKIDQQTVIAESEKQQEETPAVAISGTCVDWIKEAGVEDINAAHTLLMRESTCRPDAVNSIGCIGIGQNCPDKDGNYWLVDSCPDWKTNPVCQIKRFTHYAVERYGSWNAALSFSNNNGWY